MRKLLVALFVILPALTFAQGLGFNYSGKNFDPVAATKIREFDSILGLKLKTEILAYAGAQITDGKLVGGGAWVAPFNLAQSTTGGMSAYLGISAHFTEGRPVRLGLALGVRF